jgi:hypothetical protein
MPPLERGDGLNPTHTQSTNRDGLEFRYRSRDYGAFCNREAPLSETEPILLLPRALASNGNRDAAKVPRIARCAQLASATFFNRRELHEILAVYRRKVASGEWRDYAIDAGRDKAVFSVFRRTSESPLYRIEKDPRLMRKQAGYSVVAATGLILKRGSNLRRVLGVLEGGLRVVGY